MPSSDPEPNSIVVEKTADGVTTIGINRPGRRNAINPPTATKLRAAFLDFERDSSQKICVFHGIGGTFCSGFDLSELRKWDKPTESRDAASKPESSDGTNSSSHNNGGKSSITRTHFKPVKGRNEAPLGPGRMQIEKPVICAISGHAVAGGMELSLLADIRVVEEDAIFGIFSRRFGVPLLDGGTVRLQEIIGLGRALDILLTGRPVGATEALHIGLAAKVVPKGDAFQEAMKMARALAAVPQECLNADRKACYHAAYNSPSFEDALSYEFEEAVKVSDLAIKKAMNFNKREKARL
ncbi:carnitinyl-CoA dehydratase [Nannizzia gypsea CBS 118893]|uniref:Carnitinyl-CoA dehydratase n=1 Tax=Arthroderma gypseum (strain ATCC MYA-4604 / CBS 118893) TaxID=535722 RepID=E4UUE8_ARTGP|nr:carnitinyl-CoA dehydratase [Nannizzia gypsea CBS 118893]EFR00915.1 carnitinyl-CoA dehydratase [Nannizzia gypsea CBS 118893]